MKKYKILFSIMLVLLLVFTPVNHLVVQGLTKLTETENIEVEIKKKNVNIMGKLDEKNEDITIIVYRKSDNARSYIDQSKTNSEGEFNFEFALQNGKYSAKISTNNSQYTLEDINVSSSGEGSSGGSNEDNDVENDDVSDDDKIEIKYPTDIEGHWAEENIKGLIKLDAIVGYTDNTFKPNNNITRAEFATILVKAFDLESKSTTIFNDTIDHWAKDYISVAAGNRIILGYGENLFGPDDLITREQMAVMIIKTMKIDLSSKDTLFADSNQVSEWAEEYVSTAVNLEVIVGYPDKTFKPQANATRAEAVTVIMNGLRIISN